MNGAKIRIFVCLILFITILTSCLERKIEVEEMNGILAEKKYRNFIVTIQADKSIYQESDPIDITATLTYIGNEAEITIDHRNTQFMFIVREHQRDITIQSEILDSSEITTLYPNVKVSESFVKTGIHENDPFYEQYFEEVGFPTGSYTVTVVAEFNFNGYKFVLPASIDFIVIE